MCATSQRLPGIVEIKANTDQSRCVGFERSLSSPAGNALGMGLMFGLGTLALTAIGQLAVELARESLWAAVAGQMVFATCFLAMLMAGLAYLLARQGELRRKGCPVSDTASTPGFSDPGCAPLLSILIPSYNEEPEVVRRTLMSAALQRFAGREVVLLIDNPPYSTDPIDRAKLQRTRGLIRQMQELFDPLADRIERAQREFDRHCPAGSSKVASGARALVECCDIALTWLEYEVRCGSTGDHADRLMIEQVFEPEMRRVRALRATVAEECSSTAGTTHETNAIRDGFVELLVGFRVEFSCFERKKYAGLSHEPNKAMNLNSYIDLMGRQFVECAGIGGRQLMQAAPESATKRFRNADLVLTLDADSILVPAYSPRLAAIMLSSGNDRIAVVQTPYSAFPNAPGLLERIAGAQTDVQYLVHQGFTAYGATFWVGANALLRMSALRDIVTYRIEDGVRVATYIQDRTVIEDTESSIDLVDRSWRLQNHPQRLAFSATPPDFGSLLIQRHRWANGGLIILPKALHYLAKGPVNFAKGAEALLRVHYLSSVAIVNLAFLLMLFGPFERNLNIVWVPLAMLPMMLAYAIDLVRCGYRWRDMFHVYALNLVLIPVSLGGTLKSLHQIVSGRRTPFGRTPKVAGRTAAHGGYIAAELFLLFAGISLSVHKLVQGRLIAAALISLNVIILVYGLARFVGLREGIADLWAWLRPSAVDKTTAKTATTTGYGLLSELSPIASIEEAVSVPDSHVTEIADRASQLGPT